MQPWFVSSHKIIYIENGQLSKLFKTVCLLFFIQSFIVCHKTVHCTKPLFRSNLETEKPAVATYVSMTSPPTSSKKQPDHNRVDYLDEHGMEPHTWNKMESPTPHMLIIAVGSPTPH